MVPFPYRGRVRGWWRLWRRQTTVGWGTGHRRAAADAGGASGCVAEARGRDRGQNRLGAVEAWGRNVRSGWVDPQGWRQLKMEAVAEARGEDGGAWAGGWWWHSGGLGLEQET
jgi:hypothetical protein